MKRMAALFLVMILICSGSGCGGGIHTEGDVSGVKIDYGDSEIYSVEDMDAAIRVIEAKFRTWNGCELHTLAYGTDAECSEDNIRWMNELEDANDAKEHFTQCILFTSDFHTPKHSEGGFESDKEYINWQWWLARSENGKWKLMTWGY